MYKISIDDIENEKNKTYHIDFDDFEKKIIDEQVIESCEEQSSETEISVTDLFGCSTDDSEDNPSILSEGDPEPYISTQSIKERLDATADNETDNDIKQIEEFAARANEEYEKGLKETENTNDAVPNEIKDMVIGDWQTQLHSFFNEIYLMSRLQSSNLFLHLQMYW